MLGQFKKAEKYFKHCRLQIENKESLGKHKEEMITTNLRLGKLYSAKLNDQQSAIECFERILCIDPTNDKALYQIGLIKMQQKDLKSASQYFKDTLKYNPRQLTNIYSIYRTLYEQIYLTNFFFIKKN